MATTDRDEAVTEGGRPVLRLLHNMARSGGTLVSRCLGSMRDIVLLSEIHPVGVAKINPLRQAWKWHGLFTDDEVARYRDAGPMSFENAISLIHERCLARGGYLLLRDWAHLDFTGVPFVLPPLPYQSGLAEALAPYFDLKRAVLVRHPLDQWLSLRRLKVVEGKLSVEDFLAGYRHFAELAVALGYVRYEDFTRAPDDRLRDLCGMLGLPYDPGYADRWPAYDRVTGDIGVPTHGGESITSLPRRPVEKDLVGKFDANDDYRRSLDLLGYEVVSTETLT